MEYITLNNGIKMPKLGYGVYQTPPEDTQRCVLDAIDVGYRSIDTAQAYGNEEGVGAAIAESGLPREEFFLTTKVWITNAGYEKAKASIEASMEKLRTDYLDLLHDWRERYKPASPEEPLDERFVEALHMTETIEHLTDCVAFGTPQQKAAAAAQLLSGSFLLMLEERTDRLALAKCA